MQENNRSKSRALLPDDPWACSVDEQAWYATTTYNAFFLFCVASWALSVFVEILSCIDFERHFKKTGRCAMCYQPILHLFQAYSDFSYQMLDHAYGMFIFFLLLVFTALPTASIQSALLFNRNFLHYVQVRARRQGFLVELLS